MPDNIKLMVVDDEENVLRSVKKVITSKHPDYHIDLFNSPAEAIENIKTGNYDIVITDLMMPGIDGLELIQKIISIDKNQKIIMITGYATMRTALLAMREGATKYISKPFTRDELLAAVHAVLEGEENGAQN